jgi:uncharacterized membrane protein
MFGVQIHTLVTHFPIALTVAVFFYDAWGYYSRTPSCFGVGSSLTRFAAIGAIVAVGTGFSLAGMSGLGSGSSVTGHAGFGVLAATVLVALMLVRYAAEAREGSAAEAFSEWWLGIELLAVILVVVTAVIGHRMG